MVDALQNAARDAAESGLQVHDEVKPLQPIAFLSKPANLVRRGGDEQEVG